MTVQINSAGFLSHLGLVINDEDVGFEFISKLRLDQNTALHSLYHGDNVLVEAFDHPLIVQEVEFLDQSLLLHFVYEYSISIAFDQLLVDPFDRYMGFNAENISFVFSEQAQEQFFDQTDQFDDDGFTLNGKYFAVPPYYKTSLSDATQAPHTSVSSDQYWTSRYAELRTGWDLDQTHPALTQELSALKQPKSRVLVLGCGRGHDAILFEQKGHVVTAVDFSEAAIAEAKQKYPSSNINWQQADAFKFCQENADQYDLIVEHTLFCAIDPTRRAELVKAWHRALTPGGCVMAVLFANPAMVGSQDRTLIGPPYGATEFEIQSLIKKKFRTLKWKRIAEATYNTEASAPRFGRELFAYIQKV